MTERITATTASARSRTVIECARTYGVEARCHHFDRDWHEVRAALAAGWDRACGHYGADWCDIEPDVHAAWQSTVLRDTAGLTQR